MRRSKRPEIVSGSIGSESTSGPVPLSGASSGAGTIMVPWTLRGDHLVLAVRLTPKSARDEITGVGTLSDGRSVLQVRVRALPQDGRANEALVKVLAKALGLPVTAVRLDTGATGRVKTLRLSGDVAALQDQLARLAALP